jgi:hypothetical protein
MPLTWPRLLTRLAVAASPGGFPFRLSGFLIFLW